MTLDNISADSATPLGSAVLHIPFLSFASQAVSHALTPCVGLILSLLIILAAQYARSPWRRVPPGPRGLPVLGNALQLKDKGWMFGKDCKRKFGVSSSTFSQSSVLCIYQQNSRTHNVPEYPGPAHNRF